MLTSVVNLKEDSYDIYIGRGKSKTNIGYGNPFSHLHESNAFVHVASRAESIEKYRLWLEGKILIPGLKPPALDKIRRELKGKVLGCWCKPLPCHGDVLAQIANS